MDTLIVFTDGACSGNPGPGWAIWVIGKLIIKNPKLIIGAKDLEILKQDRKKLDYCTNNEAEYKGAIYALKDLLAHPAWLKDVETIQFRLDSKLVVEQLNGRFKVKNAKIAEYVFAVHTLLREFKEPPSFIYVPREQNLADKLKYD